MNTTQNFQHLIDQLQGQPSIPAPIPFSQIASFVTDVNLVLFETPSSPSQLERLLAYIEQRAIHFFETYAFADANQKLIPEAAATALLNNLPKIKSSLIQDIQYAYKGDPSATSHEEISLAYPGIFAIGVHRIAHTLYKIGYPVMARLLAEYAHRETGIDIHPGATIGHSFFIDHGTGIVIGETCIIGNRVSIYHGVTLGVHIFEKDEDGQVIRGGKRHPTIEDDVSLYAKSAVLGGNTIIGKGSIIGSNVTVTKSVPAYSKVFHSK